MEQEKREEDVDEQLNPPSESPDVSSLPPDVPEATGAAAGAAAAAAPEVPERAGEAPVEKKAKTGGKWTLIVGAVVIVAGLIYLLYELGWFGGERDINHWWGFLILIPAVASWVIGWVVWNKKARRFGWAVVRWLVIGLALVALALVFAFKDDLNEVWPVLAIIVGVGIALSWKG